MTDFANLDRLYSAAAAVMNAFPSMAMELHAIHLRVAELEAAAAWRPIADGLPDFDRIVWMQLAGGQIIIGARHDDGDGWLWGNAYGSEYWDRDAKAWKADCEVDDDYEVVAWRDLPTPFTPPGAVA